MKIAVVGAGIVGRLIAWRLLLDGHDVTVFDKDSKNSGSGASYTAAGMLAPLSELVTSEPALFRLGERGLELWRQWSSALSIEQAVVFSGTVTVAHASDQTELHRQLAVLQAKSPESAQLKSLTNAQLGELEPDLANRFSTALFMPSEAYLYPDRVLAALAKKITTLGGHWLSRTCVKAMACGRVETELGQWQVDLVIDSRGMGAAVDLDGLRGVRGELISVSAPDVNVTHMVRLIHPRYPLYLVPRPNQQFIIGATQLESEDYSPMSVLSALELLTALYSLHPGFAEARIESMTTNCRPALADNLPRMGYRRGLLWVNGLFRHGYLLAPVLAQFIAQRCKNLDQLTQPWEFNFAQQEAAV